MAVRSANGVGKTYLAADLALWFLYTHRPSLVLTTAPTGRQVRHLLWEEIHRRVRRAAIPLRGRLVDTRLEVEDGWFAIGLTADSADSFQGFHSENLLIVMDEASGIADSIWAACEGVAVGRGNRILAIGNPLRTRGRFFEVFQRPRGWALHSISAMDHPNVVSGEERIPGGVSRESVSANVKEWCEPAGEESDLSGAFEWDGRLYVPNGLFRSRVLGEFPASSENALIDLRWLERAFGHSLTPLGEVCLAADVARHGSDRTVIGVRVGPVMTVLFDRRGLDLMQVTGEIVKMAREAGAARVVVDDCGLGGGVVDRLFELGVAGVAPVNGANRALNSERFANRRAELFWTLREGLRRGEIGLKDDDRLRGELGALRYVVRSDGRIAMERKEEIRRRGGASPDFADMAAMLFMGLGEDGIGMAGVNSGRLELERGMAGW